MRNQCLILGFIFIIIFQSKSENINIKTRFPFEVVYTENAFIDAFGTPLKQFSLLEKNQKIILKEGHLILVHFTGKFYEFEGSETLFLGKIFKELYETDSHKFSGRPAIKHLFSDINPYVKYNTGAVIICFPPAIRFDFIEHKNKITVNKNRPVKLSWSFESDIHPSGNYRVEIRDIFDEILAIIETDTSVVEINLEEIDNEAALYILMVYDNNIEDLKSYALAIEVDNESVNYTGSFFDEPKTAIDALQRGFELEKLGNIKFATNFYQKAVDLSDKQVYQLMLDNFLIRAHDDQ